MNAVGGDLGPVCGRLDETGRLVEADSRLIQLNQAAGGAIGAPLALPALADIGRLVRRLGVTVSRKLVIADGQGDLELWVRAEPEPDGVRLVLSDWRHRPAAAPVERKQGAPIMVPGGGWRWETDAALRLIALSPEAGPRDGFHPAAVLGQPLTGLFSLIEDAQGAMPLLAALAANRPFDGQAATLRPSGRRVVLAGAPRHDRLGAFAGFIGTTMERADDAPRTSTSVDLFVTRLGAALRAPLGRIIANADSIGAAPDGPLHHTYAGYAADIATAGRHLLGLVDDLADLEAIERPDFTIVREPIDLADLARRAAGLLAVRASAAEIRIERPADEAVLAASGAFRRVLQILVNLIGNAIRYAPSGSVVSVIAERQGDTATVTVTDQGKGIAAVDHARVFDKFARIEPAEPGGSGLGLYIARRLARAMGGDITLQSAPGDGARFTLHLPVAGQDRFTGG